MQTRRYRLLSVGIGRPVGYIAGAAMSDCLLARVCVMRPSGGFARSVCTLVGIPYLKKKKTGTIVPGGVGGAAREDKILDPLWNK